MGKGRKERLEDVVTQAINSIDVQLKTARSLLKNELKKSQASSLKKYYDTFMMIDIYPENSSRFGFDAVQFERKIKSSELKIN